MLVFSTLLATRLKTMASATRKSTTIGDGHTTFNRNHYTRYIYIHINPCCWVDDNQLEVNHHLIWLVKYYRLARCMVYLTIFTIFTIKTNHSCTLEVKHHFINGGSFRMINPDLKEWWLVNIKNGGWTSRVYLRPWIRWFANVPQNKVMPECPTS